MAIKIKYYEKGGHAIRYLMLENELWFNGRDIANVIDYVSPGNALQQKVSAENRKLFNINGTSCLFINNKGVVEIKPKINRLRINWLTCKDIISDINRLESNYNSNENVETATFEALWDNASEDVKNAVCQLLLALANQPKVEKKIIKFV